MNRAELSDYLRTRRDRVTPRDAGLPDDGRRRVPGLRREEVAQLARISVDYYIRLEQRRGPRPSRQVLNALARALMLSGDERAHLFHLAGETPEPSAGPSRDVPEAVRHLLDSLQEVPAYVIDAKYDMLAWNRMAELLLFGDDSCGPGNVIRRMFGRPDIRDILADEERGRFARSSVADLRHAAARYPDDRGVRELVAEMIALSPEFAELWATHDVRIRRDQRKQVDHPRVGRIEMICQVLHIPDRDQRLVVHTTVPGSGSEDAFRRLRALPVGQSPS